ncbi:MAG: NADPH-dependent F420 reductase [Chloroflexi bacterium]|nr:NADPH-dependent F420 reductase [Chloroflexota bacterium]
MEQETVLNHHTIAILGGTGHEGSGLGLRWAKAGHSVIIGSRAREKAEAAATEINGRLGSQSVRGLDNAAAAQAADIVVLTVPYSAHTLTLEAVREAVQGKVFVDVTVPLVPPKVSRVQMPAAGSASQEAQTLLGNGVKVVTAFQSISAEHLKDPDHPIDCDVLVCGDDKEAKAVVIALAADAGMKGYDAGPLANAVVAEGLTSVLIGLNQKYKVKSSGIKITGI